MYISGATNRYLMLCYTIKIMYSSLSEADLTKTKLCRADETIVCVIKISILENMKTPDG